MSALLRQMWQGRLAVDASSRPISFYTQTQLADALGVNPRTVRRWVAGELPIPDLRGELLELIRKRRSLLLEARNWLDLLD